MGVAFADLRLDGLVMTAETTPAPVMMTVPVAADLRLDGLVTMTGPVTADVMSVMAIAVST